DSELKSIYLEAGEGDVSLSFFRSAPLKKRTEAGLEFIQKGWMQGAEYFNLTSNTPVRLFGIENQKLYQESIGLYDSMFRERQEAQRYLNQISVMISALKQRVYQQELRTFDRTVSDYQSGVYGWTDYVDYLFSKISKLDPSAPADPGIVEYRKIRRMESEIDFEKAQSEAEHAIESLNESQRLLWNQFTDSDANTLHQITSLDDNGPYRYLFLEEILRSDSRPQKLIKGHLKKYLQYLESVKQLDLKQQIESVQNLQERLYLMLTRTSEESRLHEADLKIQLLDKLIHLKADPELIQKYMSEKPYFSTGYITALINRIAFDQGVSDQLSAPEDELFESAVQTAEEFYKLTEKRDRYFVETMMNQIRLNSENEAVLIVGGYHGPNIESLLRQEGISYTVWVPAVSHETDQNRYEKILLSQKIKGQPVTVLAEAKNRTKSAVMVQQLMMGLEDGDDTARV
ncbi:MAG: hypothetical protein KC649_07310, partial [Candidatus Omnitrophica bacterium]|nr:hypothetical protein [Candidatus Omnitrophota bacterium]